MENLLIYYS